MRERNLGLVILILALVGSAACSESDPQGDQVEQLLALGYIDGVDSDPAPQRVGATTHDERRASVGHKLFVPYGSRRADLIDARGSVLHSWSATTSMGWQHVELGEDLSLYVIAGDRPSAAARNSLFKLDRDSNLLWTSGEDAHHDLDVADNGDIYVLTRGRRLIEYRGETLPINENYITVLDREGRLKNKTSIFDLVKRHVPDQVVRRLRELGNRRKKNGGERFPRGLDILHTNTLEIFTRDLAYAKKGSILLSLNRLSLVVIIDSQMEREVWSWGPGEIDHVHMPTLLRNDNLLMFENGSERKHSRVIELEPVAKQIVWEYVGNPREDFFSGTRGSAQQLSSGNILITESNKGHVVEIGRDKEVLWEYWNPHREEDGTRRAIYRMIEVDDGR